MSVAVWNPTQFVTRYPEFTAVVAAQPATFAALFLEAGDYLDNTCTSPVRCIATRGRWLNMITAHIAFIGGLLTADGQPKPVGRVTQGAEGSVSAAFEMDPATPGSGPWFKQSQYGAAFWQASQNFRGFMYIPAPRPIRRFF